MYEDYLPKLGTVSVGCRAGGNNLVDLGGLPASAALEWGREAANAFPEADCLHFPCPHWAVAEAIEPLERECDIDVVTIASGHHLGGVAEMRHHGHHRGLWPAAPGVLTGLNAPLKFCPTVLP